MGYITILPQDMERRAQYLNHSLPRRYMEDYTLLGFAVASPKEALELLKTEQYISEVRKEGFRVRVNSAQDIQNIHQLFRNHGLAYEFGDLADSIYQA